MKWIIIRFVFAEEVKIERADWLLTKGVFGNVIFFSGDKSQPQIYREKYSSWKSRLEVWPAFSGTSLHARE